MTKPALTQHEATRGLCVIRWQGGSGGGSAIMGSCPTRLGIHRPQCVRPFTLLKSKTSCVLKGLGPEGLGFQDVDPHLLHLFSVCEPTRFHSYLSLTLGISI